MNEIEARNAIELSRFLLSEELFPTIAFEQGVFTGDAKELSDRFEFDGTELKFDLFHGQESVSHDGILSAAAFLGMRPDRFYMISQFNTVNIAEAFCKIEEVFLEMSRIFGNKYTAMVMKSHGNYDILVMPTIWPDWMKEN